MDEMPHEKNKPKKPIKKIKEKGPPPLSEGEVDLRVKTPLLWVILLFVPVVLGLLLSLRTEEPTPEAVAAAEAAQAEPAPVKRPYTGDMRGRRIPEGGTPVPAAGINKVYACDFAPWIGLQVSEDMKEALRVSNRPLRILPPDSMMTMDHAPARVNFDVDAGGVITRVWCG